MIRYCIIFLLLATVSSARAETQKDQEQKQERFNQHKQEMKTRLDTRISTLQKAKTCVESAQDHEALRTCHDEFEKHRDELPKVRHRDHQHAAGHRFEKERDKIQKN